MALYQSKQVVANKALLASLDAADTVTLVGEYVVPAGIALNDIIEFAGIPAYHLPVDLVVDAPGFGSTVTLDAGIITGRFGDPVLGTRTCGNEFFAASTVGQAGGVARKNKSTASIEPTDLDRGVGLKIAAAPGTVTAGGVIRFALSVVPATLK